MSDKSLILDIKLRKKAFRFALNTELELDGVTAIFGPSGSGKTTALRLIAGLERPDSGRIILGREVLVDTEKRLFVPPHKRSVGLVFQTGILLPGRSVAGNLRFAEARRRSETPRHNREEIIKLFDINELMDQDTQTLSGGERQRVALAQALLADPELLLLDEPLAGLDRARKRQILPYLKRLNQHFGLPILYVSHDLEEVAWMADRVLALESGNYVGYGSPEDIVSDLNTRMQDPEKSIGSMIYGQVTAIDSAYQMVHVAVGADVVKLPLTVAVELGSPIRAFVHAEDVAISTERPIGLSMQNCLEGTIVRVQSESGSGFCHVHVNCDACVLVSRITALSLEALDLAVGKSVYALFKTGRKVG